MVNLLRTCARTRNEIILISFNPIVLYGLNLANFTFIFSFLTIFKAKIGILYIILFNIK